nr:STAS domain-containing protein [Thiocystis violacea]
MTALDPGRWGLGGALDFTTVMRLAAEGDALFKASAERGLVALEVDLSAVEQANSAALALLLEWLEMARSRGLRLTYRHLPASLERIAAFSNLTDLLPLAD